MIVGLGMDLAEIDRIARSLDRFGRRFAEKVLTPAERAAMPDWPNRPNARAAYVASRFAAKEAALKALGTGMACGIGLHDVEVGRLPSGQPTLTLRNKAAERAESLGVRRVFISLTHSLTTAGAVVILEA
jgi:holo-[acyl-carrier protein] synthase